MRPVLLDIFGVRFGAYRTCLTVAFVVCTLLAVRMSQRRDDGTDLSPTTGIWAFFGALIGAKVFFILQYQSWTDVWRALLVWQGGLVFYGGLAGSVIAVAVALRIAGSPVVRAIDIIAVYTPLGQAITRVGCFLNGCCYGVGTKLPWGVRFPRHSVAHTDHVNLDLILPGAEHTHAVHPSQLYMVTGLLLIFATLRVVLKRKQIDG
ncbi:MAG: prolipoprotein diacylglyceryl transferase, partial [bacterium]|nr:prolipoprotein diacylglyceryl transferase [bacterium]